MTNFDFLLSFPGVCPLRGSGGVGGEGETYWALMPVILWQRDMFIFGARIYYERLYRLY